MKTHDQLSAHQHEIANLDLRDLIERDDRAATCTFEHDGLLVDLSRHLVTADTFDLLRKWSRERDVFARRDAMFAGDPINTTECRSVMHVALRNQSDRSMRVDRQDVMPAVRAQLDRMRSFVSTIHDDRVGCRNVDTRFDDGGTDKQVESLMIEVIHDAF